MEIISDICRMQSICEKLRNQANRIKLIPTMGALHDGHVALIDRAHRNSSHYEIKINSQSGSQKLEERVTNLSCPSDTTVSIRSLVDNFKDTIVVVSIFVNPTQFNNQEDYFKYSRTMPLDISICKQHKVNYIFAPKSEQIYPDKEMFNLENHCSIVPSSCLANDLEGKSRPGHFQGMLTIVNKLFNIIKPHEAYFGEKDYQQLVLVKKMVYDLNMDVSIRSVPTVRDKDMLPLSSRNIRLNKGARQIAPILYELLISAKQELDSKPPTSFVGVNMKSFLKELAQKQLSAKLISKNLSMLEVDYLELRCAKDLSEISFGEDILGFNCKQGCGRDDYSTSLPTEFDSRLLISIIISGVRLLDNIEIRLNVNLASNYI